MTILHSLQHTRIRFTVNVNNGKITVPITVSRTKFNDLTLE